MCFRYKLRTDNYKSNDLLTTQDRELPPPHPPSGDALNSSVGSSHGYLHYYSVCRMIYTTIRDWNSLPKDVLSAKSVPYFEELRQQNDRQKTNPIYSFGYGYEKKYSHQTSTWSK